MGDCLRVQGTHRTQGQVCWVTTDICLYIGWVLPDSPEWDLVSIGWQEFLRYTLDCSSLSVLTLQISSSNMFLTLFMVSFFIFYLIVLSMPLMSTDWCLSIPPLPCPYLIPGATTSIIIHIWGVLYLICVYLSHLPLNRASWERNRVMFIKYHQ